MDYNIEKLKELIDSHNNIVFFGGAGVSTESGIPDFRSKDGLYNMIYKYPPEEILSHTFFINNTEEFYKFYKDKLNCLNNKPNPFHKYLTKLEKENKLKVIITQNIDGLHQKAGSTNVLELHSTIYQNHCLKCHKKYSAKDIFNIWKNAKKVKVSKLFNLIKKPSYSLSLKSKLEPFPSILYLIFLLFNNFKSFYNSLT